MYILLTDQTVVIEIEHFKCQSHLCLHATAEDLNHYIDEWLLEDQAFLVRLRCQLMESIANDAWQSHILDKSHLIDILKIVFQFRCRAQGQIRENPSEVWLELLLYKEIVYSRVEVFNKEKCVERTSFLLGWMGLNCNLRHCLFIIGDRTSYEGLFWAISRLYQLSHNSVRIS